ncbi:unnamed protein product [Ambrosiozyma monospora]|uniref:Unnamed protein product n=1 Tax=Ambrosiozyma monospora TaxID=43982 RepID=A0ACB5TAT6_AMBMO|nr:unnamed protein product [Ambrosiozyma monospora]
MVRRNGNPKLIALGDLIAKVKQSPYNWIHVHRDTWCLNVSESRYFKVQHIAKKNVVELGSVTVISYYDKGEKHPIKYPRFTSMFKSRDIDQIFKSFDEYLKENPNTMSEIMKQHRKFKGDATDPQLRFLKKVFAKTVSKSSNKLNKEGIMKEIDVHLNGLTKKQASDIIFSYTVSRSSAIQVYILEHFLNKKEKRKSLLD